MITRSLGARQSGPAGAEGMALRLKRGDRVMLCSDGLTAHVEDKTIAEMLRAMTIRTRRRANWWWRRMPEVEPITSR